MSVKDVLHMLLHGIGYDIHRFDPAASTLPEALTRRRKLFESYGIDVVLDIGANSGRFGREVRNQIGFSGKLVSFEPLRSAFELLRDGAIGDANWETFNCALGDEAGHIEINVAGNSESSSFLNMLPAHVESAPDSAYIGREMVEITTLDSIFPGICPVGSNVYLKIDTQGFERRVIAGARNSLDQIDTIQLEMSLVPLYQNELLFGPMHDLLTSEGYTLVSLEPGFWDHDSGQLLQTDGIYHRLDSRASGTVTKLVRTST